MYQVIIIDDEPKLSEVLKIKLANLCPEIEVIGVADNAKDGYEMIVKHQPGFVFLDIAMPGESGFDLLDRFSSIDFEIIFVTGFSEYGLDALKVSAVDYLLKPVDNDSLVNAVNKVKKKISTRSKIKEYEILKHNLQNLGEQNSKIAIPGTNAYEFVKISEIIRCEGWQKYTKIFLTNGDVIVSSYNIGVFKDMISKYGFYSTHKSHLVNKTHIIRYLKDGTLILSDNSTAPVSRRKKDEFLSVFVKQMM